MTDSYRLTIMKRLSALLEGTELDNGETLAGKVFRGRSTFGNESPDTMISILEATKPGDPVYVGDRAERKSLWPLIIQGWTKNDTENPTDPVYQMMAAVEVRLARIVEKSEHTGDPAYPSDFMLGSGGAGKKRLITQVEFGPGVVSPARDQVSSRAFFFMPIWVTFVETTGKPYFAP